MVKNPSTVQVSIVNSKNNSNTTTTTTAPTPMTYPPSPPERHAGLVTASSKPLTMANVAAIPSSFSTISTTPTSDSEASSELSYSTSSTSSDALSVQSSEAEMRFLEKVFGADYHSAFSRHGVKINSTAAQDVDAMFPGAILESAEHATKTLYISPSPSNLLTRDSLIELMDLAIDEYECTGIVICLSKSDEDLEETLHELMYVGGAIVSPDAAMVGFNSKDYVLVGLDL